MTFYFRPVKLEKKNIQQEEENNEQDDAKVQKYRLTVCGGNDEGEVGKVRAIFKFNP